MSATAPTAVAIENILASLAKGIVNAKTPGVVGSTAGISPPREGSQ
jgi:hypothetical protein